MTPETAVPIKESISTPLRRSSDATHAHHRIDLFDFDDRLVIKTEIPDVELEDIDLRLEGRDLVVYAARHDRTEPAPGTILRRIPLPFCMAAGDVQATFDNNVLRVEVRRPGGRPPHSQKINVR
jgi:HSP20 family protein